MMTLAARLRTLSLATGIAFAFPAASLANGTNVDLPNMNHSNGSIHVSADIISNCILQTSPLDFGQYDPLVNNATLSLTATSTETALCTKGTSAQLTLASQNTGATYPNGGPSYVDPNTGAASAATMSSTLKGAGGASLGYTFSTALDAGPSYLPNTGNYGGGNATSISFTGAGVSQPLTVLFTGTIAPGQDVPNGLYADTIVATISF